MQVDGDAVYLIVTDDESRQLASARGDLGREPERDMEVTDREEDR